MLWHQPDNSTRLPLVGRLALGRVRAGEAASKRMGHLSSSLLVVWVFFIVGWVSHFQIVGMGLHDLARLFAGHAGRYDAVECGFLNRINAQTWQHKLPAFQIESLG